MTVLEIYLEILTNFFEILYPPLRSKKLYLEHDLNLEHGTITVWNLAQIWSISKEYKSFSCKERAVKHFPKSFWWYIVRFLGYSVVILFKSFCWLHLMMRFGSAGITLWHWIISLRSVLLLLLHLFLFLFFINFSLLHL